MGLGAIFFKPKGMTIESASDCDQKDKIILESGKFFAEAFWTNKGGSKVALSSAKMKTLERDQMAEFRRRYSLSSMNRQSELVVAQDANGQIMGCAGIEVDIVKDPNKSFDAGIEAPLMSNVAVGKKFRRKGIAEDLVKKAEEVAIEWGYSDIYLLVERQNSPAIKLYSKAGYRKVWEDGSATTLIPSKSGLKSVPTVISCMRKKMGGGLFSNFLPF